jgi:hypothetical protein
LSGFIPFQSVDFVLEPRTLVYYADRSKALRKGTIEINSSAEVKALPNEQGREFIIFFKVDDFIKLYNMQKDIASGLYLMQDGKQYATVQDWNEDYFKKYGNFEFLTSDKLKQYKDPFTVDYTGFGFILIKQGVFEKLKYPWFRPIWKCKFNMHTIRQCRLRTRLPLAQSFK